MEHTLPPLPYPIDSLAPHYSKETLEYEVTIDDPRTYTRPWKAAWTFKWMPGDIQEQFCETGRE